LTVSGWLFDAYPQKRRVRLTDLIFTKQVSKNSDEYSVNTVKTSALHQLEDYGKSMRGGQVLRYIISDSSRKNSRKRTVPVELINEETTYDTRRYAEVLAEVCNSVTEPFGYMVGL
jgi:DNA polymerase, archaea type